MTASLSKAQKSASSSVIEDPRWARIVARDKTADGTLWYSISSTGVSVLLIPTARPPDASIDFTGGEFLLTEQKPRMQSRAEVVPLRQGDAVAFAVHHRPVRGSN
jgi:hypothetical protein